MINPHERHENKLQKEIDQLRTELENTKKFRAFLSRDNLDGRKYICHLIAELQRDLDRLLQDLATRGH